MKKRALLIVLIAFLIVNVINSQTRVIKTNEKCVKSEVGFGAGKVTTEACSTTNKTTGVTTKSIRTCSGLGAEVGAKANGVGSSFGVSQQSCVTTEKTVKSVTRTNTQSNIRQQTLSNRNPNNVSSPPKTSNRYR